MVVVPPEIWIKIAGYIDYANPVLYTKLATISKSAYYTFTCDFLWRQMFFKSVPRNCFRFFLELVFSMDFESRDMLQKSWAAVNEYLDQVPGKLKNYLCNSSDALYFREIIEYVGDDPLILLPIVLWHAMNKTAKHERLTSLPLLSNREFVELAVSLDGRCLALAPNFCDDYDIVLRAVSTHGQVLELASPQLKQNHSIVLAAVSSYGTALRYVDPAMANNREIALRAVQSHGWALQRVTTRLQADKEIVLTAVINYCGALQLASLNLRSDKSVVMAAVAQQGWTLQYASENLRDDIEVVKLAVKCDTSAIKFASARLLDNKELMQVVVAKDSTLFDYASPRLKKDLEFISMAKNTSKYRHICRNCGIYAQGAVYERYANWIMETWESKPKNWF